MSARIAQPWLEGFPGAITVSDPAGIILWMNDKAAAAFAAQGGRALVGTNMLDCHPAPARAKLQRLMDERRENVYTTEKGGMRKLVYQAPWYDEGVYAGFVEMIAVIPAVMPHFIRDNPPGESP